MKPRQYTATEVETMLSKKFKGKNCSLEIPGYKTVYGMVDRLAFETVRKQHTIVIIINETRYTVSLEALHDCLKILGNGNTH